MTTFPAAAPAYGHGTWTRAGGFVTAGATTGAVTNGAGGSVTLDLPAEAAGSASGLFSIVLKPAPQKAVDALLDTVKLFGMGFSWGGFESLVIPFDCDSYRTATTWTPGGPTLRLHIGLENVDDLKADLERGFAALKAASS